MNRRDFLQSAVLGGALTAAPARAAVDGPKCDFPATPRERLAIASYPFRAEFDPRHHKRTLLEFPKMAVERFGVNGIEPLDQHFPSMDASYLAQFRRALRDAKAHVVNIPVGELHGSFYDPDEKLRNTGIEMARKWIDVAVAIGSPSIRAHILPVKNAAPDVAIASLALREVAAYGQKRNVIVNMENDDPASEDALFLVQIIERVGSPWLRALPDFCNSMLLKKGEDYNYRSVKAMFEHACNICHVKEIETDAGQTFTVDAARTFDIAKAAGYRGYFSIEWDAEGDPYAGTDHLIAVSLKHLA